ncbi:sigma-70 family RNA polymerase sigma factor, partial [Mycobacterium kansasii]
LRARDRRNETALPGDVDRLLDAEAVLADESYLLREDVSRGLMVLLDRLTTPQRVAYVLHDLFAVPFADIAPMLRTSVP